LGSFTIVLFNISFALVATYIIKNPWWVTSGISKIVKFILFEGGITAFLAYGAYLLGVKFGQGFLKNRSVWKGPANRSFKFISVLFTFSAAIMIIVL
jgi:hypothetical protein